MGGRNEIHSTLIAPDPLGGTGAGDLNLDSRLGDNVAVMRAEDTVEVRNSEGELILAGKLKPR